jgi:ABC-type sugar transport system permease subunit
MALSAIALGITAASKYTYAIVGIVILIDLALDYRSAKADLSISMEYDKSRPGLDKRFILMIICWGLLAVLIFWAFNPRLWADPLGRLSQSIFYHGDYAQSEQVERAGFPAWQQLVWLAGPVRWHPGVFLVTLDLYILIFALVGFKHFWRRYRVFALWLTVAGLFLLVWPTKWPQYLLVITAPLCMSSAEGLRVTIWEPLRRQVRRGKIREMISSLRYGGLIFNRYSIRELRKAWPWLLPGVIVLSLIAFFPLIYQGAMALTDFNTMSILDGINGGVWREVWLGITGQVEPYQENLWQYLDRFRRPASTDVRYIGRQLIGSLFINGIPELLVFNILWTVLSVVLQAALGITVAMILIRDGLRLRGFWRTLFILPWAIPEFVGALIWLRLLDPERGWLAVMENFPFQSLLAGLWSDPDKTLILLLLAATWYGFPFFMLAATAGLKMVPAEVYEAATIDGADQWKVFRFVIWPLLLPLVMPAVLIRSIFAFNQFYLFYTMSIRFPTVTYATLSYFAFSPTYGGQFAISAAINIFTVVVLIVLILWFNRISRASQGVTYA